MKEGVCLNFEFAILDWFQTIHCAPLDAISVFFNTAGAHGELWIVLTLLLLVFPKTRKAGAASALALVLYFLTCHIGLKPLINRPRPCDLNPSVPLLVKRPYSGSFPSGHAASGFAAATALCFERCKIGPYAVLLACFICLTRLYLYVHFPSDVLGGALIGTLLGFVSAKCIDALAKRRTKL